MDLEGSNRLSLAGRSTGQLQANAENIPGHVLCLLVASLVASTSSNVPPAPLLRLRGGMVIHTLGEIKKDDERKAGAGMGSASMGQPVDGEKLSKDFMGMYHEKQIGGLCAVHCINNLLQGPEFNEIHLAEIARDMDRRERETLQGSGLESESGNVRADGFFSVQVIVQALQHRGFSCLPVGSSEAAGVMQAPQKEVGFILNRSEHWFSLRRLGPFWFDVNSTQEKPKFVSDAYLGMLLAQMKQDGYSVFVVRGRFPACQIETDRRRLEALVAACKEVGMSGAVQAGRSAAAAAPSAAFQGSGYSLSGPSQAERAEREGALAAALAASGVDPGTDPELAAAIAESLGMTAAAGGGGGGGGATAVSAEPETEEEKRAREQREMRDKRLAALQARGL